MSAKSGGSNRPPSAAGSARGSIADDKPQSPQAEQQEADVEEAERPASKVSDRPLSAVRQPTQEDDFGGLLKLISLMSQLYKYNA